MDRRRSACAATGELAASTSNAAFLREPEPLGEGQRLAEDAQDAEEGRVDDQLGRRASAKRAERRRPANLERHRSGVQRCDQPLQSPPTKIRQRARLRLRTRLPSTGASSSPRLRAAAATPVADTAAGPTVDIWITIVTPGPAPAKTPLQLLLGHRAKGRRVARPS